MKGTMRVVLAVVGGVVLWGLLWNLGTVAAQAAFPEHLAAGQPITHVGALLGYIAYSVLVSVAAGYGAALTAGAERAMQAVWALAVVNLAIGIAVEIGYWAMMPAWYHIVFLALVVPATLVGGRLRTGGAAASPRVATV